jgi:3alpha(or 20beta)-hydroxysteroid dehydrogenase
MGNILDLFKLDGKVALVTGAGRGLGKEAGIALSQAGAKVMLTGILATGREHADEIVNGGGEADFLSMDVTKSDDWKSAVAATVERFGGIDILVNNAGVEIVKPISTTTEEEWRKVQSINVDGVFLGIKHVSEVMIQQQRGGSIINLSSLAGLVGGGGLSAYCTSKGGVRLLTKSAAAELGAAGIRVNSIHPGIVENEMGKDVLQGIADLGFGGDYKAAREIILSTKVPLARFGESEDIVAAIVYLASNASRYMTGSELVLDGGTSGAF